MTSVRSHSFRGVCAILIATTISVQAGSTEPSGRLVKVDGTRVHLRSGIPILLDHRNVTRHLKRGQMFTVDRIDYGLAPTGHGMDGIWVHATSVRDPNVSGWIASRYVAEVATEVTAEPAEKAAKAMTKPGKKKSDPVIIIIPPPSNDHFLALANNILGILNSLLAMCMTLVPLVAAQWAIGRLAPAPRPALSPNAAIEYAIKSDQLPHQQQRSNNFYGNGWWSSTKR